MKFVRKAATFAAIGLTLSMVPAASAQAAADESPGIRDTGVLQRATVNATGAAARVYLRVRCPRGDRFHSSAVLLQAASAPATSDVTATGNTSGTCTGRMQSVVIRAVNRGTDILGTPYYVPLHEGCGIEYAISVWGSRWSIDFARGAADAGPDGSRRLCLS
jgi:hypothetical protein